MLLHQTHEIVPMLPPMDATENPHYSTWVDLSHWHHLTLICQTGEHQNPIYFSFRKGIKASIEGVNRKSEGANVVSYKFARFWSNVNTDSTATTHFTARGRPSHDSTINAKAIMVGAPDNSDDLGSRGETYIVEIPAEGLGKDANGNAYSCVQVRVFSQGAPARPSGIGSTGNIVSILGILSEPRYGGKACTGPEGRVATRDW